MATLTPFDSTNPNITTSHMDEIRKLLNGTTTYTGITPTSTFDLTSGGFVFPTSASPAQTTDGQAVWDSDDNVLTIGTGSARVTLQSNALADGKIWVGNGSGVAAAVTMSGDVTITNAGVAAIASGVIVNDDVNASAAVAFSKLAALTSGNILVGNGSNVATSVTMSGDATLSNAGVITLANTAVTPAAYTLSSLTVDSKGRLTAASSATLASTNFWVGNGSSVPTAVAMSGDATMANTGAVTVAATHSGSAHHTRSHAVDGASDHSAATLGNVPYAGVAGAWTLLAGNTTATKNFLTQTGTGAVSAAPAWGTIADGDVPSTHSGSAHHTQSHDHSAAGDGQALAPGTSITIPNTGLLVKDTDASHTLAITPGSNLTANRILTITTGDAARTVTINADTTLSGTNTGDQTITLTGEVTGSGTGSFAATVAATHSGSAHHTRSHAVNGASDHSAATQGDIPYAGVAGAWALLGAGTSGYYLKTQGAGANPIWAAVAASQEFTVGFRTILGASTSAQTGHHGVMLTNSNTIIAYAGCRLPFTPSAIYAVYQVWATGNIYRQVEGAWGAAGEAINATTDSIAYGATAVTTTVITEEDITAAFTGVASGDTISCRYTRDATDASDTAEGDGFIMHLRIVP